MPQNTITATKPSTTKRKARTNVSNKKTDQIKCVNRRPTPSKIQGTNGRRRESRKRGATMAVTTQDGEVEKERGDVFLGNKSVGFHNKKFCNVGNP
jgi:hypothetical protein